LEGGIVAWLSICDLIALKNKKDISNIETSNGDMTKAVYDTDNDGKVDSADTADTLTGLESTAQEIDEAIEKSHEHDNKNVLDLLAEVEGELQYNGHSIGGGGGEVTSEEFEALSDKVSEHLSESMYYIRPRLSGETDDNAAMQEAISYSKANGNKSIFFPSREYILGDIEIDAPISLYGESCSGTIITAKTGSSHIIKYVGELGNEIESFEIQKLRLTGNGATKGIHLEYCARWNIERVEIDHINGDGLYFDYALIGKIDNCYIHHNTENGIYLKNDSNAIHITGATECQGNKYGLYIDDNILSITIDGSTFEANRWAGIYAKYVQGLKIAGCHFEANSYYAGVSTPHTPAHIHIEGGATSSAQGVLLTGNEFYAIRAAIGSNYYDGYGIYLGNVVNPIILGGFIKNYGINAIYADSKCWNGMLINIYTNLPNNFIGGTINRITTLKIRNDYGRELCIDGRLTGTDTSAPFIISAEHASGTALKITSMKADGTTKADRIVVPAGADTVDISTSNNNIDFGTGYTKASRYNIKSQLASASAAAGTLFEDTDGKLKYKNLAGTVIELTG
jgi:hypothetical protein